MKEISEKNFRKVQADEIEIKTREVELVTCPKCNGKGEYETEKNSSYPYKIECRVCGGSGELIFKRSYK